MSRTRIAIVSGRHISTWEPYSKAATELDIGLVVLGPPGNWLQHQGADHHRDAYLPVSLTLDDSLPRRIADAVQEFEHAIHGITTFTDWFTVPTAQAAQLLGLPHHPLDALIQSVDKYKTRMLSPPAEDTQSFLVRSPIELREHRLQYPVVVKPCRGWASNGVFLAADEAELHAAFALLERSGNTHDIVVESYIFGPELDANLVMLDGELLFFELVDDFPSTADQPKAQGRQTTSSTLDANSNFLETTLIYPSKLPPTEQSLVRDQLHATLLRLGYRTGIFHLEARVRNSSMHYSTTPSGLLDLTTHVDGPRPRPPSVFLIEINVRPPGSGAVQSTWLSSGIDFAAVHLLASLDLSSGRLGRARYRAAAEPNRTSPLYPHYSLMFVPVERGGTFASDDVCEELCGRRPDLAEHIAIRRCCYKRGDKVPDPAEGELSWVAYFGVHASSREELLRVVEEVRIEARFSIV